MRVKWKHFLLINIYVIKDWFLKLNHSLIFVLAVQCQMYMNFAKDIYCINLILANAIWPQWENMTIINISEWICNERTSAGLGDKVTPHKQRTENQRTNKTKKTLPTYLSNYKDR